MRYFIYICRPNGRFMSESRENILRKSLFLFLQMSYKDVTMKDIVESTGLSKGAFYHYFSGKEELFKEIAQQFFSFGALNYDDFDKESLYGFYHQYVETLNSFFTTLYSDFRNETNSNAPLNFFFIMFEAVNRFPEFLNVELEMHKKDTEEWKKVIIQAKQTGEIHSASGDEEIANLFLYCNDGVFLRFINNDSKHSFKEYLLSAYDTIYNNLRK